MINGLCNHQQQQKYDEYSRFACDNIETTLGDGVMAAV